MKITKLESVTIIEIDGVGYFNVVSFITSHLDQEKYRILNVAVMVDANAFKEVEEEFCKHINRNRDSKFIASV